jgi:hypothetical protein
MKNLLTIGMLLLLTSFEVSQSITNRSHSQIILHPDSGDLDERVNEKFKEGYKVVAMTYDSRHHYDYTVIMEK